jgi:hypothetical protein
MGSGEEERDAEQEFARDELRLSSDRSRSSLASCCSRSVQTCERLFRRPLAPSWSLCTLCVHLPLPDGLTRPSLGEDQLPYGPEHAGARRDRRSSRQQSEGQLDDSVCCRITGSSQLDGPRNVPSEFVEYSEQSSCRPRMEMADELTDLSRSLLNSSGLGQGERESYPDSRQPSSTSIVCAVYELGAECLQKPEEIALTTTQDENGLCISWQCHIYTSGTCPLPRPGRG